MYATAIALLLLSATSQAAPSRPAGRSVLATFDDLATVPLASELNPVGVYKDLKWNSLDVLAAGVAGITVAGVEPQSGDNVAANSISDDLLFGDISITTATVSSFDLDYLYFGCVANTLETAASIPEQCTVAFTAYKKGSEVAFQTINQQFNPTSAVLSKMGKFEFPSSFSGLSRIDVTVVQATTTSKLSGLLIDNVHYTVY